MSDKVYNFKDSNKVGKIGEETVKQYLFSLKKMLYIKDVSKDSNYQDQDIDFLCFFDTGEREAKEVTFEVKTDTYDSGNIFFETISNTQKNTEGCMYKTKATYLIYYFLPFQEMFILDMKKYRNWFKENYSSSHGFYKKVIKNYEYDSVGYIFSREKLRGLPFCRVVKVVNEEDKENNHEGS